MPLTIAKWIVTVAALGVPPLLRDRFRREWHAELDAESLEAPLIAGRALLRHSLGAFAAAREWRHLDRTDRRKATMWEWTKGAWTDARVAARSLWRTPVFAATAITTLTLGLGGTTAIYALLDRVVLQPLPFPDADRLVLVENQVPGVGADRAWKASTAQFVFYAANARSFDHVALYLGIGANIETAEGAERAQGFRATSTLFTIAGVQPRLGRVFDERDDEPGGPPIIVLSEGFWDRAFGRDPEVVGRSLIVDGSPVEVVGVLDRTIVLPETAAGASPDFWVPLPVDRGGVFRNTHIYPMIARLAPGYDEISAQNELAELRARLPERFPQAYSQRFFDQYGFATTIEPLKHAVVGRASTNLWVLFGGVGVVLLLAAINIANLFMIRLEGRTRELGVRTALGAGRSQIARHILAEAGVLVSGSTVLALFAAYGGVRAVASAASDTIPRLEGMSLSPGAVLAAVGLAALLTLALAAAPIYRQSGRRADRSGLGQRGATAGRRRQRIRSTLVVAQVALALTLVAWAGLLVGSLRNLAAQSPGIDPTGVVTARLDLIPNRYADSGEVWSAYDQMLQRIRAIPGVELAGMSEEIPLQGGYGCTVQGFEDDAVHDRIRAAGMTTCAGEEATTPQYFEAAGIPLLTGRTFTDSDLNAPDQGAVVVSRAFAERFWPGEDPIGNGVAPGGRTVPPFYHVIGVVGDVQAESLDGSPALAIYYPVTRHPDTPANWGWWHPTSMALVVKAATTSPVGLVPQIRAAVAEVDPTSPLSDVATFESIVAASTSRLRFTSLLLALAAGTALVLAAVGLYGVVSYVVAQRTREIGVRIAVGAQPSAIQTGFLRSALFLVGLGLALGLVIAISSGQLLESLLFGVGSNDPRSLAVAATLLVVVAALATWLPARRASLVDPVMALRAD